MGWPRYTIRLLPHPCGDVFALDMGVRVESTINTIILNYREKCSVIGNNQLSVLFKMEMDAGIYI